MICRKETCANLCIMVGSSCTSVDAIHMIHLLKFQYFFCLSVACPCVSMCRAIPHQFSLDMCSFGALGFQWLILYLGQEYSRIFFIICVSKCRFKHSSFYIVFTSIWSYCRKAVVKFILHVNGKNRCQV